MKKRRYPKGFQNITNAIEECIPLELRQADELFYEYSDKIQALENSIRSSKISNFNPTAIDFDEINQKINRYKTRQTCPKLRSKLEDYEKSRSECINRFLQKGRNNLINIYRFDRQSGKKEPLAADFYDGERIRKAIDRNGHDFPDKFQGSFYDDHEAYERLINSDNTDLDRYVIITKIHKGNNRISAVGSHPQTVIGNAKHNLWVDNARKLQKKLIKEGHRDAYNKSAISNKIAKNTDRSVKTIRRVLSQHNKVWFKEKD